VRVRGVPREGDGTRPHSRGESARVGRCAASVDAGGAAPLETSSERTERKENERRFRGQRMTGGWLTQFVRRSVAQGRKHTERRGEMGLTIACCSARRGPEFLPATIRSAS
jgi:hypothetical protein